MSCERLPDDCGRCAPEGHWTPITVHNAPGLPALSRRVGTAGDFAATMAADLTAAPALDRLTSRRTDDPAIALVDAWSAVLDVLSFYIERIANESYLRTAQERRSLIELARSVGYAPGRGRASATVLSFTLEDAPGSPAAVPIPEGTKVASLPGPGETPQTYETTVAFEARPQWNAIPARTRVEQSLRAGAAEAYIEGIRTDLAAGDGLLLVGAEREGDKRSTRWAFRQIEHVDPMPALGVTRLSWTHKLDTPQLGSGRVGAEHTPDPRDARLYLLRKRANIFGAAAPDHRILSGAAQQADKPTVTIAATALTKPAAAKTGTPKPGNSDSSLERHSVPTDAADWPGFSVVAPGQPESTIDLDAIYPAAVPGSWAVLTRPGVTASYRVETSSETSRTDFTLNAKVTRLHLDGPTVSHLFSSYVRQTVAWVGSELLPLAAISVPTPVQGDRIDLAAPVPALPAGRPLVVRGPRPRIRVAEGVRHLSVLAEGKLATTLHPGDVRELTGPVQVNADGTMTWTTADGTVTASAETVRILPAAADASVHSEVATVASPTPATATISQLRLSAKLTDCYDPAAVRVLANVTPATHGESRAQVLGSGDAATPYQRFALSQAPLTFVPAATGTGVVSTLSVRVDGRLWKEVPRLFSAGPADEVYTTEMGDDGRVSVQFGNNVTGARLPTGTGNVTATYRVGSGAAGRVGAEQHTLPKTRPQGLQSVINPLPTGLAADPESGDDIRAHVAVGVMTLDRVVSLRDFADFARTVPGVGKAIATWLWDGRRRIVHLTVAGTDGQPMDDQALSGLRDALRAAGDPRLPLQVQAADTVPVTVTLRVVVDPRYDTPLVLGQVTGALRTALSAAARSLTQPLTAGDVIIAAHHLPGVVALTVSAPADGVQSLPARVERGTVRPAQLVILAHDGLTVTGEAP